MQISIALKYVSNPNVYFQRYRWIIPWALLLEQVNAANLKGFFLYKVTDDYVRLTWFISDLNKNNCFEKNLYLAVLLQLHIITSFRQHSEKHLKSINITWCWNFIHNGVNSYQFLKVFIWQPLIWKNLYLYILMGLMKYSFPLGRILMADSGLSSTRYICPPHRNC